MKVTRNCLNCNKEFETYSSPSIIKRKAGFCCSRACSTEYLWKQKEYRENLVNKHILIWSNPKHRKRMSDAHLGQVSARKGATLSAETKQKISESQIGVRVGNLHPMWIEDRTQLKKHDDVRSSADAEFVKQVKLRDGNKCRIANKDCRGHITVHHILGWRLYPELRYELNNGITLCFGHHPRGRKEIEMISYFQELLNNEQYNGK